jgi:hypothetical protein
MPKRIELSEAKIHNTIVFLRGKRVIIDADLAKFYGVATKVLNQAVKRNSIRFPDDFMFRLTEVEWNSLRSQIVTLEKGKGKHPKYLPYAFTEYGAVMAANVLSSSIAVQASIQVVRVFIKISEVLTTRKELAGKLEKLEHKLENRLDKHDKEIHILFEAIKQLMQLPNPPRRKIGYKYEK